jgi:two-component system, cell cycle sensor histidine kinase and response regulator CckA
MLDTMDCDGQNIFRRQVGVVHDINNMIGAILGMAEIITETIPEGHGCHSMAKTIVSSAQRCSDLLLTCQPENLYRCRRQQIEILPLVGEVVSMVKHSCSSAVKIDVYHESGNIAFYGDGTELCAALMNLCINAIEAMPDGGLIQIRTRLSGLGNDEICSEERIVKAGECIQIEIGDSGVGIPAEKIPIVFEPFFSTKSTSVKMQRGMGLYRVKQCVDAHGGTIRVKSIPANGTTFTITLPVTGAEGNDVKSVSVKETEASAPRQVTVIDKDESTRDIIASMLMMENLMVAAYSHPLSAMPWIFKHTGRASLVIIGHRSLLLDGIDCVTVLRAIDQNLKFIICTGDIGSAAHWTCDATFLYKPFLKTDLMRAIEHSLELK